MTKEALELLREFEKEWYPSKSLPTIRDFIIWLGKNYRVEEK